MASARVTFGRGSRVPGTEAGIQVNTFGMEKLDESVSGEAVEPIMHRAMTPSFEGAQDQWPIWTGASRDSIRLETTEVGRWHARVALKVGGDRLRSDPRNLSHRDYAPFIEYNGTATAPPGIIAYNIYSRQRQIRDAIHEGVRAVIQETLRGSS